MTAPSDLKEGSIIKAFDGAGMVDVCVPSDVQKGDQFVAIVVGPSADDEEAPKTVKASPILDTSSVTEKTASSVNPSSPNNINVSVSNGTNTGQASSVKKNSCMATAGLVCGIIGIFFFGIILGPLAIIFSSVAKCKMSSNPNEYGGHCQANAGLILGILDIVIWAIALVLILGA